MRYYVKMFYEGKFIIGHTCGTLEEAKRRAQAIRRLDGVAEIYEIVLYEVIE